MADKIWRGHWYWVSVVTLSVPLPALGSTPLPTEVPPPVSTKVQKDSGPRVSRQYTSRPQINHVQAPQPAILSTALRSRLQRELVTSPRGYSLGPATDYLPQAPAADPLPQPPAADSLPQTDVRPQATQIILRLAERRVYVYGDDRVLASYPVAIGTSDTPTPTGEFEIFQMIENPSWQSPWTGEVFPPGPDSALGLRWIGFFEQSNGLIGFHGTPTLDSIGQAASNGCVRMRNEDVIALFEYARMGMTVIVEP